MGIVSHAPMHTRGKVMVACHTLLMDPHGKPPPPEALSSWKGLAVSKSGSFVCSLAEVVSQDVIPTGQISRERSRRLSTPVLHVASLRATATFSLSLPRTHIMVEKHPC